MAGARSRATVSGSGSSATFSFDFHTTWGVDTSDAIQVKVSGDGGPSWTVLETITGIKGDVSGSRSYNISPWISANTRIKFRVSNLYGGSDEFFFADNVDITADCSGFTGDGAQ